MFLRSRRPYLTCITALCASASFTVLLLFAGIAAACSGGGGETCEGAPFATATAASQVTYSSAYMNGDVNPRNCKTTFVFEYRQSGGFWVEGFIQERSGTANQPVSEWLPSLPQKTTYEYRLKATNTKGTTTSNVEGFTTLEQPPPPPSVTTEAATGVTSYGATLNGSVNPNGQSTTYKFEYGTSENSLTQSTSPVSISGSTSQKVHADVSLEPGTLYYFRISAGTSTGAKLSFTTSASLWKIKATPNPEGTSDSNLYDVSCEPSTSVCTSVGKSTILGADSPLAQRWNGIVWSEQAAAKKTGATHTRLFGVDCPSETRCLAVGNSQSSEGPSVLSEIWNEGKWNVQTTPVPPEATSSEFVAIGCNSTANCTAVGSAVIGGVKKAIAERWTSPTWALSSIPIPEGAKSSQLDGVDCLWSNFCVAVGRYTKSDGSIRSLVEFWNGTEWSLQTVTDPLEAIESSLLDVSCTPTPNLCTAVGSWRDKAKAQLTLAYRFNGVTTWTLQGTPNAPGSTANVLQDVSCAAELSCTAVGSAGATRTLAETWTGKGWSIQGTPNPSSAASSSLQGVSCRSTTCMAVGWSTNSSGVDSTLSEFRE